MLHQNAFGPQFPVDFLTDVASGNLPQVSWLVGSVVTSDHPPAPSIFGEDILSLIVTALAANPAVWAKTVLLVTYDENGGFFDHVAPVTAPLGTSGGVTAPAVPDPTVTGSPAITGPIGLGFRVPPGSFRRSLEAGSCHPTSSITLPCCDFSRLCSALKYPT